MGVYMERKKYYEMYSVVEFGENPDSLRPFGDLGIQSFKVLTTKEGSDYFCVVTGKKLFPIKDLYLKTKDYQKFVDSQASFVVNDSNKKSLDAIQLASILNQMENNSELLLDYLYQFLQTEVLMKSAFKSLKINNISIEQCEEYIANFKNRKIK